MKEPAIPNKIDLIPGLSNVVIRRRWLSWTVVPILIFAVAWDSFLFFWYSQALSSPNTPWLMIVFPIGHLAVGIGITYYAVATLFNITEITIDASVITVISRPFPWGRKRVVPCAEITDTRIKFSSNNNNQTSYKILFTNRANREKLLVGGGLNDDQAEYIEFKIRQMLGLKDED